MNFIQVILFGRFYSVLFQIFDKRFSFLNWVLNSIGSGDASMRQKEKQDSVEQKPLKKGGDSSETSSRGRHDKLDDKGGAGGIKSGKSLPKAKADMSNETSSSSKYMETSESLTGTMNKMSLIGETENSSDIKIRGPKSQSKHKPEEWMLLDKESDALSQLNLAIVSFFNDWRLFIDFCPGRLLMVAI